MLTPLSLSTSSPSFFVPVAPQSFRGSSSRFKWACSEVQGKHHEKEATGFLFGPFSSITVFQSVLSCWKGSRTVMLSATATCINTQLIIYLSIYPINKKPLVSVHSIKISVFSSPNLELSKGFLKINCQLLNSIMNMGYLFAILNIIKIQV